MASPSAMSLTLVGWLLELLKELRQLVDFALAEPRAQALVVAGGDLAQAVEQLDAGVRQLDLLHAAIRPVAPAADESLRFERAQVVRHRRAGHAHRLREAGLRPPLAGADQEQDLPGGRRPARLGHRALELLRDRAGGTGELEADWRSLRA